MRRLEEDPMSRSTRPTWWWIAAAAFAAGVGTGAAITASAATTSAPLADEATLRDLDAVKQGILAGHRKRDRAALSRLYADDYTAVDSRGTVRRKEDLLAGLPGDPEMVEGKYELVAARRFGDVAVANGRGHLVYRNADGSTRVSDYYSFNVFERRGGTWLYVAAFLP
jgi:ketosteroid isomerase-like protein